MERPAWSSSDTGSAPPMDSRVRSVTPSESTSTTAPRGTALTSSSEEPTSTRPGRRARPGKPRGAHRPKQVVDAQRVTYDPPALAPAGNAPYRAAHHPGQ